jgi:pimeloyl-ACP methyl ester carboxylesterase
MTILYKQTKEIGEEELEKELLEIKDDNERYYPYRDRSLYKKYSLTFKSSYTTGIKKNDTVYSEVFINKNREAPLVLLLHGLGSKQSSLQNYYCFVEHLVKSGLNCIFLNLPFHLNRTPDSEKSGERNLFFDDIDTLKFYHQAVVDIRRLLDITAGIFKFSENIICGFSMGSTIAAIALAVEKRFVKGVLVLSGGNWHQIHWNSSLSYLLKGNCLKNEGDVINKKKCREIYQQYPAFLAEFKKLKDPEALDFQLSSRQELKEKTTRQCFLCDPLTYAHLINPDKIIMINSRFDHFFNRKSTEQLWKELGNPKIYWFNNLHTSKMICKRKVQKTIVDFINNRKQSYK